MEEFQSFGDMNEIARYLRKAQTLDTKLQAAAEKVGEGAVNVAAYMLVHTNVCGNTNKT